MIFFNANSADLIMPNRRSVYYQFACYDCIMLELKALSQFAGGHEQQILNYLKTTRCKVGVLINFGALSLEYKRFVNFWI